MRTYVFIIYSTKRKTKLKSKYFQAKKKKYFNLFVYICVYYARYLNYVARAYVCIHFKISKKKRNVNK